VGWSSFTVEQFLMQARYRIIMVTMEFLNDWEMLQKHSAR